MSTKVKFTKGSRLLDRWLKTRSRSDFARDFGVDVSLLGHWIMGRRRPSLDLVFRLKSATDGEVPAESWAEYE